MPANNSIERFLGGSLASVLIKLVFLSLLVGALLAFLDITPVEMGQRFFAFIQRIINLGISSFGELAQWIIAGAIIVIPLFLLSRILKFGK